LSEQLSSIQPDGSWTVNIAPNFNDVNATEIVAFLVPTNYNQPCVDGVPSLTPTPQVEATAYAVRVNPARDNLNFLITAGMSERVEVLHKVRAKLLFQSTNNVWVDAQDYCI